MPKDHSFHLKLRHLNQNCHHRSQFWRSSLRSWCQNDAVLAGVPLWVAHGWLLAAPWHDRKGEKGRKRSMTLKGAVSYSWGLYPQDLNKSLLLFNTIILGSRVFMNEIRGKDTNIQSIKSLLIHHIGQDEKNWYYEVLTVELLSIE